MIEKHNDYTSKVMHNLLFQTKTTVLMSFLVDGALQKKYTPWSKMYLQVFDNAMIVCSLTNCNDTTTTTSTTNTNISTTSTTSKDRKYDVYSVLLTKIVVLDNLKSSNNGIGIKVACKDDNRMETNFRMLLSIPDMEHFCSALSLISKRHNVLSFQDSSAAVDVVSTKKDVYQIEPYRFSFIRTNVVQNIDKVEKLNLIASTKQRRGSFHYLPIAFSNDLVHGSWWFVFGSLLTFIIACLTLYDSYNHLFDESDDELQSDGYRTAWALVIVSGFFCTVGSLAFVRAMSDPPMKPLFKWYHFSSDELFGSWMFLLATLPAVPYSLIYLAEYKQTIYLIMFFLSIAGVVATLLFVFACYPSDKDKNHSRMLPFAQCVTCNSAYIRKHCATDWLIATWGIYWSSLLTAIAFLLYSIYTASTGASRMTNFVNVTTLFECVLFLIGSAYFVAGSYPSTSATSLSIGGHQPHQHGVISAYHNSNSSNNSSSTSNRNNLDSIREPLFGNPEQHSSSVTIEL